MITAYTYTSARTHLKELLDNADRGTAATITRDHRTSVVVDRDRLLATLMKARPAEALVVAEDGAWTVIMPGLPIAAEATEIDAAVDDVIEALRDYADDWTHRLSSAPNHALNWDLVQLVGLADDDQLRAWINGRV